MELVCPQFQGVPSFFPPSLTPFSSSPLEAMLSRALTGNGKNFGRWCEFNSPEALQMKPLTKEKLIN